MPAQFKALSWFAHYYIWVQSFLIPVSLGFYANIFYLGWTYHGADPTVAMNKQITGT